MLRRGGGRPKKKRVKISCGDKGGGKFASPKEYKRVKSIGKNRRGKETFSGKKPSATLQMQKRAAQKENYNVKGGGFMERGSASALQKTRREKGETIRQILGTGVYIRRPLSLRGLSQWKGEKFAFHEGDPYTKMRKFANLGLRIRKKGL